jgi:hypothetical protein
MRPRIWMSLLMGLTVGLLAWMLPPLPRSTFRIESLPSSFHLENITSDGRFLFIDYARGEREFGRNEVWDCQNGLKTAWISFPAGNSSWNRKLSPDESLFAARVYGEGEPRMVVYELASGRAKTEYPNFERSPYFGSGGELLEDHGRELRHPETKRVVHRAMPMPGFDLMGPTRAPYVLHQKGHEARICSLVAEERLADITLPYDNLMMMQVFAEDGLVVRFGAYVQGGAIGHRHFDMLVDFRDGARQTSYDCFDWSLGAFTPDGRTYARFEQCEGLPFFGKLWSGKDTEKCLRVVRWADDTELARFRNIEQACFSPKGNLLAVVCEDRSFAIYDFPFRKPWGLTVTAVCLAAFGSWSVAWIWTRWRMRLETCRQWNAQKLADATNRAAFDS